MSELKFINDYNETFYLADPFETGEKPFYGEFRDYLIQITCDGIDLYRVKTGINPEYGEFRVLNRLTTLYGMNLCDNDPDNKITYENALSYTKLIEADPEAFIKLAEKKCLTFPAVTV